MRAIGFLGTLGLAALLSPESFGLYAFGAAVVVILAAATDGGIGADLIRDPRPPERRDVRALVGFQFAVTVCGLTILTPMMLLVGEPGKVAAVMTLSVLPGALRIAGLVQLERDLVYSRLVVVELGETLSFFGFALVTAAMGWGVWSMAVATVVRGVVGSGLMVAVSPLRVIRPVWDMDRVKPRLRFGAAFQGAAMLNVLRHQGRDIGIGWIAGFTVLGVWSLAFRLVQVPFILFDSLWRVSFPAIARSLEEGADVRPMVERAMRLSALGGGAILASTVAVAPVILALYFGPEWSEAGELVWMTGIGVLVSSPVSIVAIGYLYAVGDSATVLRLTLVFVAVGMLSTFGLLPLIGVPAIGVGWIAQAVVGVVLLGRELSRLAGVAVVRAVWLTDVLVAVSAAVGLALAHVMEPSFAVLLVSGLAPLLAIVGLTWGLQRDLFDDAKGLALGLLRREAV